MGIYFNWQLTMKESPAGMMKKCFHLHGIHRKPDIFCKTESNSSRRDTTIVNFQLSIRYIPICRFLYKAKHRKKNAAQTGGISSKITYLFLFSHFWLAMPLLVLQADWQEVWHSPQPPFLALWHRLRVSMVWICFMGRFLLVLFLYS